MVDFAKHIQRNRMAWPSEFKGELFLALHSRVTADVLEGQHPIRAWEYTKALNALDAVLPTFDGDPYKPLHICDVGGAGSNFYKAILPYFSAGGSLDGVDPNYQTPDGQPGIVHTGPGGTRWRYSLEEFSKHPTTQQAYHVVFCLSVIEHVKYPNPFLLQLTKLVKPGGLLFLTCDAAESRVDTHHFHWMREWIANPEVLDLIALFLVNEGFSPLGAFPDFRYQGPTVFDYTVAALAFVKDL